MGKHYQKGIEASRYLKEISKKSQEISEIKKNLCNHFFESLPTGRQVCNQGSVNHFFRAL
jgi:hypothetical protein